MPESTDPEAQELNRKPKPDSFFSIGFWLAALLGIALCGFVAYISFRSNESVDAHWVFFVGSLLNSLIFMAIVFQAFIYSKQWDTMVANLERTDRMIDNMRGQLEAMNRQAGFMETQTKSALESLEETRKLVAQNDGVLEAMRDQVKIMGVAFDPRLRITRVRVENFEAGKEPVFLVSIKNEGATDARDVTLHIRVSVGHSLEGVLAKKWREPRVVSIPAGQEQHYFVAWETPLPQERIDRFNNRDPLTISGSFQLGEAKQTDFCYRYYPWKGERPKGVAQFIPCDFDTSLATVVTPQTKRLSATPGEPSVEITKKQEAEREPTLDDQ